MRWREQFAGARRRFDLLSFYEKFEHIIIFILTVLIAVEPTRRGGLTIDGWLAPGSARTVRLRIADGQERETLTDDAGRFGYADVTPGLVQVVVVAADDRPGVVTPTFEL